MSDDARIARRLRMLRQGIAADFTVICGDREWKVSKGTLCAESEYLETLCVGSFGEAAEGKVTFKEEEPEVVDQLLVFCYTGQYDHSAVLPKLDDEDFSIGFPPKTVPQKRAAEEDETDEQKTQAERDAAAADWLPSTTLSAKYVRPLWEISPRLNAASKEDITKVLRFGVLTYAFAKMMGLTTLELEAGSAFINNECFWIKSDMAQVLEAVFRSTACDDDVVRLPVLTQCIENSSILEKFPEAVQVIRKHELPAWDFSMRFKAELAVVQNEHDTVKEELSNAQRCNHRNIKNNANLREEKRGWEKEKERLQGMLKGSQEQRERLRADETLVRRVFTSRWCSVCQEIKAVVWSGEDGRKLSLKCGTSEGHVIVPEEDAAVEKAIGKGVRLGLLGLT